MGTGLRSALGCVGLLGLLLTRCGPAGHDPGADAGMDGRDATADAGGDDDGSSSSDTCGPSYCDCSCPPGGYPFTAGPCCAGDEVGSIDYWTEPGPDGCPRCRCGFRPRRVCEHGCFREPLFGGWTASCGEEIIAACGDGSVDPPEECEPGPSVECSLPGCSVPGRLLTCTPACRLLEEPRCLPAEESCADGIDDDCDSATDEGCADECCSDLVDDNGDGMTDCNDPTCDGDPACASCRTGPEICWDGCDNDLDCRTDADDEDCPSGPGACGLLGCPTAPEACSDSCDNDRDGLVDCADPDCSEDPRCAGCTGQAETSWDGNCRDWRDNDCDGMTDECDLGCAVGRWVERCGDGEDNDGDGSADCSDDDCSCDARCLAIPPEDCRDGEDNDGDGLIDTEDWECPRLCE